MDYEYKCVGAPERPKRQRGVRGRSERVALAMQEIIDAEAVDGWEYQRTDLVPVEEKNGFFSRTHEVHRAVLIFRRELEPAPRVIPAWRGQAGSAGHLAAGPQPAPQPERTAEARGDARGEPRSEPRTEPRNEPWPEQRREPRSEQRSEGRISLAADRDEPAPPARGNRPPPSGLG